MKKLIIILFLLVILASSVQATTIDKIFSREKVEDDICQDGEFPLINKECNINLGDIADLGFLNTGWFLKLLVLGIGIYLVKNRKVIRDPNFIITILFLLFLLIAIPIITEKDINKDIYLYKGIVPNETVNETKNDTSIEFPKSSIELTYDKILNFPKQVSEKYPFVGWLLLFGILVTIAGIWDVARDWIDKFLGRL